VSGGVVAQRVLAAAQVALAVPVVYLGGLTAVAVAKSRRPPSPATPPEPSTRFVVLVPADAGGLWKSFRTQ
jgi:hypothetical protein